MSLYEAHISDGKKAHKITLSELTLKDLKRKIAQIMESAHANDKLIAITDGDGCCVENDENVIDAFEDRPNPLVLLTGAIKYKQLPYLEGVKRDLLLFQRLFQSKFGYQVFNTYDPKNSATESLTASQLESFLDHHKALHTSNACFDAFIFVWCGHGGFGMNGDTLITSDEETNDFKDIQNTFMKSKHFVKKPKIFIKIGCRGEQHPDQIKINRGKVSWYNIEADTFIVFATTPGKVIADSSGSEYDIIKKGSYFTEIFCQTIEKNINESFDFVIKKTRNIMNDKTLGREIVQLVSTASFDIYFIQKLQHEEMDDNNDNGECKNDNASDTLDLKIHWRRTWRKANAEAVRLVEKNDKQQ
ncbi:hypothetical protein RFI_25175 [Reticulomyxa filosa]|uniref:Peptidase C14 caspase domain-containing protein n=1 Tax=Reticulomyxa filosa TaxID=46433 RepID=X6MEU3_RETFI|nr:hypothetical protein RFI_25175 [Reticulomyxa filosa]|eukprot:ETO12201.1 hypothetical protein RFI_25175 [Reticulomyxa filosa]